jgi:hypothetical protein
VTAGTWIRVDSARSDDYPEAFVEEQLLVEELLYLVLILITGGQVVLPIEQPQILDDDGSQRMEAETILNK